MVPFLSCTLKEISQARRRSLQHQWVKLYQSVPLPLHHKSFFVFCLAFFRAHPNGKRACSEDRKIKKYIGTFFWVMLVALSPYSQYHINFAKCLVNFLLLSSRIIFWRILVKHSPCRNEEKAVNFLNNGFHIMPYKPFSVYMKIVKFSRFVGVVVGLTSLGVFISCFTAAKEMNDYNMWLPIE